MPEIDKSSERYIGDGVYVNVEYNTCIRLRTERYDMLNDRAIDECIYLEPDMLLEIIRVANQLGWVTTPKE